MSLMGKELCYHSHESLMGKNCVICTVGYSWDRITCFHSGPADPGGGGAWGGAHAPPFAKAIALFPGSC